MKRLRNRSEMFPNWGFERESDQSGGLRVTFPGSTAKT
jgi:hypothetical protein